jgi:heme/copper-type cytochrome/quinol oxidase subunit 2
VPTIVHLLLALVLTVFLAAQASSLAFVLRSRRAVSPRSARRRTDLLWTCIPVLLVLFLAARSWVAVVDVHRPAVAATGTSTPSAAAQAARGTQTTP